ncbi:Eco57I restriction-modification methylase domain-containing protein [Actinomadura chokoriensis]|uniref:site-specific DNA-methyltransferase (adenine-specific) n=1 Tax=Actinomadura chokoriensis TaxID=454156 RepID=A0ABV4R5X5_9ACTN
MTGSPYTAVRIEGGLLSADLIERIRNADTNLKGNSPKTYHLAATERLGEAASRKWEYLRGAYRAFRERLADLPESDTATSKTREYWLLRLFEELGFGRLTYIRGGIPVRDETYPVSHHWGSHVAIHLLGWNTDLDRRATGARTGRKGQASRAPQSMLQEFLNNSDAHLWGVLSNGRVLRILRDSTALVGAAYVEFDLEAIFEGELYPEFVLLFALLHQSRFELLQRDDGAEPTVRDCWLEHWQTHAAETGQRVRERLREQVELALGELGTGFLEANPHICKALAADEGPTKWDFRDELLNLVFQMIFLFVIEDRRILLLPNPLDATEEECERLEVARHRYREYFSVDRLRRIASRRVGDRHIDLWRTLVLVLDALGSDKGRPQLALPGLGGPFFRAGDPLADPETTPDLLRDAVLTNKRLLAAIRHLTTFRDGRGVHHRIDYERLGSEEPGSVYEWLLEREPKVDLNAPRFELEKLTGNQRKTTGTYYTPTHLIDELFKTTLDPVIEDYARSGHPEDLLKMRVCDPACGSGHFLVAAARRIARKYAAMTHGDDEPPPAAIRDAMHEVVRHCIYAVDISRQAINIAKFELWLESQQPTRPLAYLDPHIKVGNSLLGTTPHLLREGIPDEAYKPIANDDKKVAAQYRKENAEERVGQRMIRDSLLDLLEVPDNTEDLTRESLAITRMQDESMPDIRKQARRYRTFLDSPEVTRRKRVHDAWCAAFVCSLEQGAPRPITSGTLRILGGDEETAKIYPRAVPSARTIAQLEDFIDRFQFHHWHLEFPDIFPVTDDDTRDENPNTGWRGGFDVVFGNPPWERVKLQEKEFFSKRNEERIAGARNAAERKKLINALATSEETTDRRLYTEFQAELRESVGWSHLLRSSGRFPLTGKGDVNTYSVFAETGRTIIGPRGRAGMVLPTGIATDATTSTFFGDLVTRGQLAALLEFENEEFVLSKDVHHSFRFCLLSIVGRDLKVAEADFAFGSRRMSDIEARRFTMPPEDIKLLNPNTKTAPLFRSRRDAEITLEIYRNPDLTVLIREEGGRSNPWAISFATIFHMAGDSDLFHTREELENKGWRLQGNSFVCNDAMMSPLYEAKMVHHFDHRFGTYEGQTQAQANMGTLPRSSVRQKREPNFAVMPRYWVDRLELQDEIPGAWDAGWLLGWRDIARSTDERTAIFSILPRVAAGHTFPIAFIGKEKPAHLYANFTAFALDYVLRQKMAGTHVTYGYLRQLPVVKPESFQAMTPWSPGVLLGDWVELRVIELAYSSWEMSSFAEYHGDKGAPFVWDEERRFKMRAELDAAFFHLYGVQADDVTFIMDSFGAFQRNDPERFARTKAQILDVYHAMGRAIETGGQYKTVLDPPPGEGSRHPDTREQPAS